MIGSALKLGVAVGVAYAVGGSIGTHALALVKKDASTDTLIGAAWAGRAVTFVVLAYVLQKV